jgi:hypothetical protein
MQRKVERPCANLKQDGEPKASSLLIGLGLSIM